MLQRWVPQSELVLEHDVIPFISYPYEWPFALLKRAALLQLQLHAEALDEGFTFVDSSAYNVQFRGCSPVFVDILSIRAYSPGEFWAGYGQFCQQFLNPLLLASGAGVPFEPWYRGAPEGISTEDLARVLPWTSALSWRTLVHVLLHARLNSRSRAGSKAPDLSNQPPVKGGLSRDALRSMLRSLAGWINDLQPRGYAGTTWRAYECCCNSYETQERGLKRAFVADYSRLRRPQLLWDIGCNAGEYAEIALGAGAASVIGFDSDRGALEAAVARASENGIDLLPLFLDATNPSPDQGWRQQERKGLAARRRGAEGVLALALVHHLVIGRNVPLDQAVGWIMEIAPTGVIEFVPKSDPMVQTMLRTRKDIFPAYDAEHFRTQVLRRARIEREQVISKSGRFLIQYAR